LLWTKEAHVGQFELERQAEDWAVEKPQIGQLELGRGVYFEASKDWKFEKSLVLYRFLL